MLLQDLTKLKNLKEMIDYGAENFGERNFIEYKENGGITKKSYNQLKVSCDTFSRMLAEKNISEAHTAIIGPTSYEWIVTFLAQLTAVVQLFPLHRTKQMK